MFKLIIKPTTFVIICPSIYGASWKSLCLGSSCACDNYIPFEKYYTFKN